MNTPFVSVYRNLFEHVAYIQARTPGMLIRQEGELFMVDSGLNSDTFNKILCPDRMALDRARADEFRSGLAALAGHFAGEGSGLLRSAWDMAAPQQERRAFTVWTGTEQPERAGRLCTAFEQAGYERTEEETAMTLPLSAAALRSAPGLPGIEVVPVRTQAQLEAFARILAANWVPPDASVPLFFQRGASVLLNENSQMRLFLALAGDEPVGCGELFLSEGGAVAGLHMISVLKAWRKQGIGSTITTALLMVGQKGGASRAVLLASAMGESVYCRQGFEACGRFWEFVLREEEVAF